MDENLQKVVVQQTNPQDEENFVVVSIPQESVENIQLESQLDSGNISTGDPVTAPTESVVMEGMQHGNQLHQETLSLKSADTPKEPVALEASTNASSSGISLGTPLLQWTPQQTMYSSAEAIQQDIQILLGKLREYGQESLLITADKETIRMDGSSGGKKFIEDHESVARSFHENCFGNELDEENETGAENNDNEGPFLETAMQEDGVEDSVGLASKRKRGRPRKYKAPDEQKPDSSKEPDKEMEEKVETPVTVKKRGRPRKYPITVTKPTESEPLDEQEVDDTESKEKPEKQPYTGKKRGRPRKQPVVYDQDKEDTDSGSGGIRRSSRPAKRKVIESLGFTPPKAKRKSGVGFADLKIKRMVHPEYINVEKDITMENDQSQSEIDDIVTTGEIPGSDKSQPNELICSHCGFSAEDQEVMENHIRVEHPKVWAQILIDDTKILLALGKDPHKVQRSRPGAQVPKKEAPKVQKPKAVIRTVTSVHGGKKRRRSDGPRSSGNYSCTVCQKRYKTICLLNAHMGLVHKDRRYAQIKRRKELLKYKQRLIALKKKNDQKNDGENDKEEGKKDEEVEEFPKEAENMEKEETIAEMKAEAAEVVEKTRRSRRSTRRKSRKLDDYETDLPELYRSDEEDIDMNAHYDDPNACPLCLKDCQSANGLSEHLKRTKHGEVTVTPYPCLTCNRFFLDFKTLELHMTQSGHMGEEMGSLDGEITVTKQKSVSKRGILLYVCSLCKREFVKEENCQSHCAMKVCKKPWKKSCPIISCKKLFFENNMFFQHVYAEHKSEYPFVCTVEGCKRLFFHTAALNSHVSAHSSEKDGHFPPPRPIEDGRKRCGYCGMLFTYNENLRQHVKKIHDNEIFGQFKEMVEHNKAIEPLSTSKRFLQVKKDKDEDDIDKIDTFKRMDKTQVTIRNHVKGEEFKCYTCDETFSHIDDVGDHMVDTGHCGLPLNALDGERNIRIRIRNTGEQCYVCTLCKMEFKKKETIDKHVQDATCKKKYKRLCPIMSCRILFRNFNYFKAHMSTMHKDEFPFKCQECGKEFEQTTALNSHRNSHYKDTQHIQTDVLNSDTPMTCHICKERFRNNRELREHKEKAHEIQRKYMCDICGKKYKRKENLKDHIYMAHERDPSTDFVSCPTCGKALASRRSLRFHLRFAHTDAKPCVCEICGYSTKQLGNLAFHMRNTHSDVRPYECEWPGCGKTFKDRQLWQRHTQRHEITAGNLEKAKTYGPIFTCKICQKGFCGKYNLDKHMVCHVNEFPLSCNLCGKGVKRIGSLRRHLRTVHHFDPKTNTPMEPVTTIRKPKSLMKKEPVQINLDLTSASQEEQESIEADFKELEYQLHTDAQQKYHQILNASIEVPSTSASGAASEQKGRDYLSEAQSQVSLLEGGASIAENVIEEAVDESQIIIENVGDQYIIMNPDGNISNLEQLGRDIILAVKNDDGVVCLQMVGK